MSANHIKETGNIKRKFLWWAFWLTILNSLLYYVVANATPLLEDRSSMTSREVGHAVGYAIGAQPPPGIFAEVIGAASVPWLLVGFVCLLARVFLKGSFRKRMLEASPFILVIGLLSMAAITRPIWDAVYL